MSPADDEQWKVEEYFSSASGYWREVYDDASVVGTIYRARAELALRWLDALPLRSPARVLDLGAGAGLTAVEMARRGHAVTGMDGSAAMVEQIRELARSRDFAGVLEARLGDAHQLDFDDETFDVVLALGLVPWLHSPRRAVAEMARVTRNGGCVLVTADNRSRLSYLIDPRLNPWLARLRAVAAGALEKAGLRQRYRGVDRVMHRRRQIDRMFEETGLVKARSATVGFGPFTFWAREIVPQATGIALHRSLQRLADRGVPIVRSLGSHYVVLASKPK